MDQTEFIWARGDLGAVCPKCKKERTTEGHDPCLGHLSGVQYACCGHGCEIGGYIYFNSGQCVRIKITDIEYYPALSNGHLGTEAK